MKGGNEILEFERYNTAIKDIAGVQDISTFYRLFEGTPSADSMGYDECNHLLSDIRTEKSRTKIAWAIKKSLLQFYNEDHRTLVTNIFSHGAGSDDFRFAFFWHFILTNRLFREISIGVFSKVYYSGRASISQNDIIPFIKEIKTESGSPIWAEETIYRLATKYLSLVTKLNFVSSGRIKSFNHIRPSTEAQILFLYFSKLLSPSAGNILIHEMLPVSFVPSEDVQDRLKKLSLKGFFNMNFNGVALNIELTHSYEGICDALYN